MVIGDRLGGATVSDDVDTVVVADPVELGLVTRVELDRQHITGVGPVALVEGQVTVVPLAVSQSCSTDPACRVGDQLPPSKDPKLVPGGRVTVTVLSGYSRAPDDDVVKPIVQLA